MGGGGPNIWQEYRPIRGSVQWLLVQPSTCASLHVALLKMLLKNKNAALLTPKFAWSTVHTSNFFSKLSQCGVEYILPTRKPCSLSRVWYESSAGEFWSYRVHMLRGAVPVPPNALAKNCTDWQVRYSGEGEGDWRLPSCPPRTAFGCIAMPCSHAGSPGFPRGHRTVTAFWERKRSQCRFHILGESTNH